MTDPNTPSPMPLGRLAAALVTFQSTLPRIERDRKVVVETKGDKPDYGYSYATLGAITATIMPLLSAAGLSYTAFPTISVQGDGKTSLVLRYFLMHQSGEHLTGEYPISAEGGIQAKGGAITYARRYCLLAVTGLAPDEDDDAAAAAEAEGSGARGRKAPPTPRTRTGKAASAATSNEQGVSTTAPAGPDSEGDRRRMFGLFRDMGLGAKEDREARLSLVMTMLGRPIESVNDLTPAETSGVLDALGKAVQQPESRAAAVEIYQRTSAEPAPEPAAGKPSRPAGGKPAHTSSAREALGVGDGAAGELAPWDGALPT